MHVTLAHTLLGQNREEEAMSILNEWKDKPNRFGKYVAQDAIKMIEDKK